ncbi:MAG: TolB family protein [Thermoleophilia bacterium]
MSDYPFLSRFPIALFVGIALLAGLMQADEAGAAPVIISRASTSAAGVPSDGYGGYDASISADGRFVAFEGEGNLVPGDTNGVTDIFVKNTQTGAITRVSTSSEGIEANAPCGIPAISGDGRYVVFDSAASNLVAGDSNATGDVFMKDVVTGTTTRISVSVSGLDANDVSYDASVSDDGRVVSFRSRATDLVSNDTNSVADIFVRDIQAGTTSRASTTSSGVETAGNHDDPSISPDGRYVAFGSTSTTLVSGDTNAVEDVFVKEISNGTTTRVSTSQAGAEGNGNSADPAFSYDGRYVVFASSAANLVSGDTNGQIDVFRIDRQDGSVIRASLASDGTQADAQNVYAGISGNGRFVVFESNATNLVPVDTNAVTDVFVNDTYTGDTVRVSTDLAGVQGDAGSDCWSHSPISADGRMVVFASNATNLVPGGATPAPRQIFIRHSDANAAFTWYDNVYAANWILMANPSSASGDAWFDLTIAGQVRTLPALPGESAGQVPPGMSLSAQYAGVMDGPVDVGSHSRSGVLTSQRILWAGNSLEEVVGTDSRKLSNHFYWAWYDEQSPGYKNWVLVNNPGLNPVFYRIKIAGVERASGSLDAGVNVTPRFGGVMDGPVEVEAWSDSVGGSVPAYVMASQRVLINGDTAFNEVPGIPATELSGDYLWTWYDNHSPGAQNWVMIANPDGATDMHYEIWIGGVLVEDDTTGGGTIPPGGYIFPTFGPPDVPAANGPVEVKTFSAEPHGPGNVMNSIASQRVIWGPSFEEVPGYPYSALTNTYHWTWYDQSQANVFNWVMVAKQDETATNVYYKVLVAGVERKACTQIPDADRDYASFAGVIGGPVEVRSYSDADCTVASAPGNGIMASQRVLWKGYFNEVVGTEPR